MEIDYSRLSWRVNHCLTKSMPGVRLILRVNYASLDTREIYYRRF